MLLTESELEWLIWNQVNCTVMDVRYKNFELSLERGSGLFWILATIPYRIIKIFQGVRIFFDLSPPSTPRQLSTMLTNKNLKFIWQ
jgi:hypothetical protein